MTNEEVYRKYSPELLRFASGLVGPDDAQDVLTDACLKSFGSPGWSSVGNKRAYLFRAVLNETRMHHRSTMRRRARERRVAVPEASPEVLIDPDILHAVSSLSVRQRAVVFLTYWCDLPPEEIAALLGISPGSVRRHLARGRSRLKEALV